MNNIIVISLSAIIIFVTIAILIWALFIHDWKTRYDE